MPFRSRAELVTGTQRVLEQLTALSEQARALGERARERVMTLFTWRAKVKQTLEVYRRRSALRASAALRATRGE